ncbi:MAG: hypothetical protein P8177_09585, partial [Gemmatimonadota bacterium]
MEDLLASPRIADLLLAVLAAEAVAVLLYRRLRGRGPGPGDVARILLPGAGLALALRAALAGAAWPWMAAALLGAGVAHAADLSHRMRETGRCVPEPDHGSGSVGSPLR